tara:strand:+ start:1188 stop:2072 length:885 start_codon:yes stop_codon:yes gene_type:complete
MSNYIEEFKKIIEFYSSNVSQSKIKIYVILVKDYYLKIKNYIFSILKNFKRSQNFTKERYERIWNIDQIVQHFDINSNNYSLYKYKEIFLAHSCLTTKIQQILIINQIKELKPSSVLEIGCGPGITLKLLADIFLETNFFGIDQSIEGIKYANDQKKNPVDPIFKEKLNFQFNNAVNNPKLKFENQDAKSLKFSDKSFDLVFSNLALEQMDNIKYDVLSEIKRVARKYIIMIEPFKDLNKTGLRYLHHTSKQYFSLNHTDIKDDNFAIIEFHDQLPALLSLNYGMLILKRKQII